jgi:hypothetical protein
MPEPPPGEITARDHWYESALATSGPMRSERSRAKARDTKAKIFFNICTQLY